MLARPHPCIEATVPGTGGVPGVGGAPGAGGDSVGSGGEPMGTGGDSVGVSGTAATGGTAPVDPGVAGTVGLESSEDVGDENGCACRSSGGRTGSGWLFVLPVVIGLLRRRRP